MCLALASAALVPPRCVVDGCLLGPARYPIADGAMQQGAPAEEVPHLNILASGGMRSDPLNAW